MSCFGGPIREDQVDDQTERDRSVHAPDQTSLPDNTHMSQISQTVNLFGLKKASEMVSAPVTVSSKTAVDVSKFDKGDYPWL